jgi:hypothetical protein
MRHTPSGDFQTDKSWSWLSSAVLVVPDDVLLLLYHRRRDAQVQYVADGYGHRPERFRTRAGAVMQPQMILGRRDVVQRV